MAGRIVALVLVLGLLGYLGWWFTQRSNEGTAAPPPATTTSSSVTTTAARTAVTHQVTVPGNQLWTDTTLACQKGDTVDIAATGTVQHNVDDPKSTVDPNGLTEPGFHIYNVPGLPDANTVALIGSLDKQAPFVVGTGTKFSCDHNGEIYLGINDQGVGNNSGQFDATVTVTPMSG
jgi:hypothetical protein